MKKKYLYVPNVNEMNLLRFPNYIRKILESPCVALTDRLLKEVENAAPTCFICEDKVAFGISCKECCKCYHYWCLTGITCGFCKKYVEEM